MVYNNTYKNWPGLKWKVTRVHTHKTRKDLHDQTHDVIAKTFGEK